jgi:hypothetical protein
MKQLIEDLISALEYHVEQTRPIYSTTVALQAAREALKSLPPQRTWVGLTDEEIEQEFGFIDELLRDCVQRTESKLKEKNT